MHRAILLQESQKNGHAISSFVSDMSYGFSGNLGYPITTNWNYDQFTEISGYGGR